MRANGAELSDFTASCATWCKQKLSDDDDDDDHDEHDHDQYHDGDDEDGCRIVHLSQAPI